MLACIGTEREVHAAAERDDLRSALSSCDQLLQEDNVTGAGLICSQLLGHFEPAAMNEAGNVVRMEHDERSRTCIG